MDRKVETMVDAWKGVELKDACEKLIEGTQSIPQLGRSLIGSKDNLLEITDEMDARLEYFQEQPKC